MTTKATTSKKAATTNPEDIIQLILNDHKPLKELIKIMKGEDSTFAEKQAAFKKFGPLLTRHAKPEEQTWYISMKEEDDMRVQGMEGDVEHGLADQMCEEAKRTTDKDLFQAKVKVLAELVEHHIKEEEEDMLPEYKKNSDIEERVNLGMMYLQFQAELEAQGNNDAPKEGSVEAVEAEENAQAIH